MLFKMRFCSRNIRARSTVQWKPPIEHPMLPNYIPMIIIGPSGWGKTQLLLKMIMKYLKWNNLYLIAPGADDQHQVLRDQNEIKSYR